MLHKIDNYPRFSLLWLMVLGVIGLLCSAPAQAYPVIGQDIYYHGGALQFEILPADAGYTSQIFLYTDKGSLFLGNNSAAGVVINLSDPSVVGLSPGEEFVLGIHVINTGNDFVMGGAYDNPDGIVHAVVDYLYSHVAVIGFEDLFGGGDLDYNDARVKVAGDIGIAHVAEPSTLILFGSGLLGLVSISRRYGKDRAPKKNNPSIADM